MEHILTLLFLGTLIMTLRAFLIVIGFYKEPVLRQFESYGEEIHYSPFLSLILWAIGLCLFLMLALLESSQLVLIIIVAVAPVALMYSSLPELIRDYPDVFLLYPRWYRDLTSGTSREERRRIAYMWLRLPMRTRLLYNARDEWFREWADLVLLTVA